MIAPLIATGTLAGANELQLAPKEIDLFNFDPAELDPIRFTRAEEDSRPLAGLMPIGPLDSPADYRGLIHETSFSFKIKPRLPDFSKEGAYGLHLFDSPRLDVSRKFLGVESLFPEAIALSDGLEYSAGFRLEHEDTDINGTSYVSSSLLGLSYGRLGQLWYGGIDVNLEQFSARDPGSDTSDVLTLDVTTGRRFGITGLGVNSPLWMLSFNGNVDVNEWESNEDLEASSDWYINPSLFWQQPGFMFSAEMQLPVEFETLDEEGVPDYRLRAVFQKQFK